MHALESEGGRFIYLRVTTLSFHQSVQKRIRWEEIDGLRENGREDSQHVPAARLLQRAVRK